ncbi:hypothetical protein ScPMuIL_014233 [Solemya velum]
MVGTVFLGGRVTRGKKLFTPGPLGTSHTVKKAMLKDVGSRDVEFVDTVKYLRNEIIKMQSRVILNLIIMATSFNATMVDNTQEQLTCGVELSDFTCIPMQGSGTYAVESVFQSAGPSPQGKVLILENGAYGKRMKKICELMQLPFFIASFPENEIVDLSRVEKILEKDDSFTMVSIVHCETSSGVINPVESIGEVVKRFLPDSIYFVDAMSSFGAIPIDLEKGNIDFLVTSANKCLEGVPGFSLVIARLNKLLVCEGKSRTLSLDLFDQYEGLEKSGQFRFTPATHSMLAFKQALHQFNDEGRADNIIREYQENREILRKGMRELGFEEFLDKSHEGYIITSYQFPKDPNFDFTKFYQLLNDKGQVIYPGKVLDAECFRIGNIGHLFPDDMRHLLRCLSDVCKEMGLKLRS